MTKPTIDPDAFFEKINTLVDRFSMEGEASIDTSYRSMADKWRRSMSWNISYAWTNDQDGVSSCRSFCPHTFDRIVPERDTGLRGRPEPLAPLNKYSREWIEEDNAFLAAAGPHGHKITISFDGKTYIVTHDFKTNATTFKCSAWEDVLHGCMLNALRSEGLTFDGFLNLSDKNKDRVLCLLNKHPIHNNETAQMYRMDMANHLKDTAGAKASGVMRKM